MAQFRKVLRVECTPTDTDILTAFECRIQQASAKEYPHAVKVSKVMSKGLDTEMFRSGVIEYTQPRVGGPGFTCETGTGLGSKAETLYCYRGKR